MSMAYIIGEIAHFMINTTSREVSVYSEAYLNVYSLAAKLLYNLFCLSVSTKCYGWYSLWIFRLLLMIDKRNFHWRVIEHAYLLYTSPIFQSGFKDKNLTFSIIKSIHPSIYQSIHQSIYLSIYQFFHLFIFMSGSIYPDLFIHVFKSNIH